MIALVSGTLALRREDHVVVLCGGVGYRIAVSTQTLASLPLVGEESTLHTHLIVRDDALSLHGFATEAERDLFLALLGVQAVGPKLAMVVLGAGSVGALHGAIAAGDAAFFQGVPGIGKRTAERIIVELREKVGQAMDVEMRVARAGVQEHPLAIARAGLAELGYGAVEADALLTMASGASAEELMASALRASRRGSEA